MNTFTMGRTPIELITQPRDMVRTLGRIHLIRRHGRMTFADLWSNGHRIQIIHRGRNCPWLVGMWVDVQGPVSPTQSGELSIWIEQHQTVGQSSRPLEEFPDSGRHPSEQSFVLDPSSVQQGYFRSRILRAMREFFWDQNFQEVSTPVLSLSSSGATARPFQTYARAMEHNMFLRVAPETHLIRLMMAGFDRIFEIGPCFRNEGISERHQPQFELMECYRLGDVVDNSMDLAQQLLLQLSTLTNRSLCWRGTQFNFEHIERRTLLDLVQTHTGCRNSNECVDWLASRGQPFDEQQDPMHSWVQVFDLGVEHLLQQPTFVTQWPSCVSPLAHSNDGILSNRFELYVCGIELANGYEQERSLSVQRARFENQVPNGEGEVMGSDQEYLFAMGWGMPPLSGFGIGVDRLIQMLGNFSHIRQSILFPL